VPTVVYLSKGLKQSVNHTSTIPTMLMTNGQNNLKRGETVIVNTNLDVSCINLAEEILTKKYKGTYA